MGSCKEAIFSPDVTSNVALPKSDETHLRTKEDNKKHLELFKINKIDESISGSYEIIDGVVHFKSFDSFQEVLGDLNKFRKDFEKDNSTFNSLDKIYMKILKEGEKLKVENDGIKFLEKHKEYVSVVNENLVFKFKSTYDFLLNEQKILYVGKTILYFNGENHFIIYDGDLKKIKDIDFKKANIVNVKNIDINATVNKKMRTNSCTYLYGEFTSYNNRRGISECYSPGGNIISTGNVNSNGDLLYNCYLYVNTEGRMKKKILWFWQEYFPNNQNELTENYLANCYLNGNLIWTIEPDNQYTNNSYHIFHQITISPGNPNLVLTEAEAQGLSLSIEERAGRLFNWDLSGASVWYVCQ